MGCFTVKILKTERDGEEFLVYGKSMKDIAADMGISPYLFKKQGWKIVGNDERKFMMSFLFVSKGESWSEKASKNVIRGPFTEEELAKRTKEDAMSWRHNANDGRDKRSSEADEEEQK